MYALALGSLIATKYPKGSDDGKLSDGRCSGGGYHASRLPHPAARNASTIDRFSATDAIPPVRQLARPTRRYSIGVMPSSSAAKTSGWSASNVHSCLWLCSSPRPKKLWTLIVLWTPLCHLADARQVNWAASGAPFSTSRASSSA